MRLEKHPHYKRATHQQPTDARTLLQTSYGTTCGNRLSRSSSEDTVERSLNRPQRHRVFVLHEHGSAKRDDILLCRVRSEYRGREHQFTGGERAAGVVGAAPIQFHGVRQPVAAHVAGGSSRLDITGPDEPAGNGSGDKLGERIGIDGHE